MSVGPGRMRGIAVALLLAPFLLGFRVGVTTARAAEKSTGPWKLDALRKAPRVTVIKEGKPVTSLTYAGEPYRGKPTRVFAYLARPEKVTSKVPAMVLVHGGGGTAFKQWAELWA